MRYDPRDILDKRLLISYLEVNRPNVYLRRRADHQWSFRHVFPDGPKKQRLAGSRSIGDYIVMDSAVLHDVTFTLTDLWAPPDSLKGARRDSAIKVALKHKDHEWRRTREGIKQTRRWTHGELRSPYVRLADPDSAGKLISIGDMRVSENDPPFELRNATGPVQDSRRHGLLHAAPLRSPGIDGPRGGARVVGRARRRRTTTCTCGRTRCR